jgi:hypothetical protein
MHRRLRGAVASLLLPFVLGMSIANAATVPPARSDEAPAIRKMMSAQANVPQTVIVSPEQLSTMPSLRSIAYRSGIITSANGAARFTAGALRGSTDCADFQHAGARCFPIARTVYTGTIFARVRQTASLDSGGKDVAFFSYRAMPINAFARALAAAGALVCEDPASHAFVPWRGQATAGTGAFSYSWLAHESPARGVITLNCPLAPWSLSATETLWNGLR